jgi:hypothetical protein
MDIKELYELYKQHPVITTDSRDCPEGSIFLALKGETFDGNKFALQALEKGCAYAIVDDDEVYNLWKAALDLRSLATEGTQECGMWKEERELGFATCYRRDARKWKERCDSIDDYTAAPIVDGGAACGLRRADAL